MALDQDLRVSPLAGGEGCRAGGPTRAGLLKRSQESSYLGLSLISVSLLLLVVEAKSVDPKSLAN